MAPRARIRDRRGRHGGTNRMKKRYVMWAALAVLVGGLAGAAAGCGGSSGGSSGGGGDTGALPTKIGPGEGALNLIAWEGYTEDQWVKPVEEKTGCQANAKYAGSSDEMGTPIPPDGGRA